MASEVSEVSDTRAWKSERSEDLRDANAERSDA